ncbi:hypothetical protein Tco_1512492 [Tanacetum coccineum]
MAVSSSQKRKFVVLSLGTGVANKTGAYDAREMTGWDLFRWYWYGAHKHFIANQEIVDEHYLKEMAAISNFDVHMMRVQEHNLGRDEAEMDISTSENMNNLADVGRRVLDQQAKRNII